MDKNKTIENMAKFYNEIYQLAINDSSVPQELQLELDNGAVDFEIDSNIDSWIKTLNFLDTMNVKLVKLAKEKPELYENCRILNRKFTILMDAMKKVMEKDLNVCGFMRHNGRIEVVL